MKTRKLLSLLLAMVLLLTGIAAVSLAEDKDLGKYDEPITVTLLSEDHKMSSTEYDINDPTRTSAHKNAWITAYKDYLNIDIKREVSEDETALNARLNTGMASGDLPDIMIVSQDMFYVLAENGVLADLSDVLEGYEQGVLLNNAFSMWDGVLETAMYEGELLGIPQLENSFNSTDVLWIRQDWLDKVNMAVPTTIDELCDVAQAFLDAKLGGDNAYAIALAQDNFTSFFSAYGSVFRTKADQPVWTKQEDGSYIYTGTDIAHNSPALLKMQEMYKRGLLSKDIAVSDNKVVEEAIANSQVGIVYGMGWMGATSIKNSNLNDENANWIAVRIPTLDGEPVKQWTNATVQNIFVVNANCEHPEALLKMIELELTIYYEGNDEEKTKLVYSEDNYPYWDFRIFRDFTYPTQDFMRMEEIVAGLESGAPSVSSLSNTQYQRVKKGAEGDRSERGYWTTFTQAYPIIDQLNKDGYLVPSYTGPKTETMTLYQSNINEALFSAMYKVVMGEDISVYEKAVEDWYKNGGQTITDEVNAYYKANGL